MRAFFALEIDPAVRHAIEAWRDSTIPPMGRAVPAANLHITLNFLGDVTDQQLHRLYAEVEQIKPFTIELHLNQTGYYPTVGIFWIAASSTPARLTTLVARLRHASSMAGIKTSRKTLRPHITLFRNYRAKVMWCTSHPSFRVRCDGFVLLQSVIAPHHGAHYQTVRSWPAT